MNMYFSTASKARRHGDGSTGNGRTTSTAGLKFIIKIFTFQSLLYFKYI